VVAGLDEDAQPALVGQTGIRVEHLVSGDHVSVAADGDPLAVCTTRLRSNTLRLLSPRSIAASGLRDSSFLSKMLSSAPSANTPRSPLSEIEFRAI
jgi:hypothetical protein